MTKVAAMVLAALLSCGGGPHHPKPAAEWAPGATKQAQRYADWCGGRVTDRKGLQGGPYVVDCDR
jgi:hypothetical protein